MRLIRPSTADAGLPRYHYAIISLPLASSRQAINSLLSRAADRSNTFAFSDIMTREDGHGATSLFALRYADMRAICSLRPTTRIFLRL